MDVMAATNSSHLSTPTSRRLDWLHHHRRASPVGSRAKSSKVDGSGILLDIVVGIIGGFLGGFLLERLGFNVAGGRHWFTFFTALLGAVILLFIVRLVRSASRR